MWKITDSSNWKYSRHYKSCPTTKGQIKTRRWFFTLRTSGTSVRFCLLLSHGTKVRATAAWAETRLIIRWKVNLREQALSIVWKSVETSDISPSRYVALRQLDMCFALDMFADANSICNRRLHEWNATSLHEITCGYEMANAMKCTVGALKSAGRAFSSPPILSRTI